MLRFGAKRHVVRRALDELVKLGVVVRAPSRGAAVRDFTAQEVEEVYELRELLQGRAVERMPLPVSQSHIETLKKIQKQHDLAVAVSDLRTVDQVNDEFHRVFFSVCGSKLLCEAITRYMQLTRAMRVYPIADPQTLAKLRDEHWAMISSAGSRRSNGSASSVCATPATVESSLFGGSSRYTRYGMIALRRAKYRANSRQASIHHSISRRTAHPYCAWNSASLAHALADVNKGELM